MGSSITLAASRADSSNITDSFSDYLYAGYTYDHTYLLLTSRWYTPPSESMMPP
jgi:hypothetical protein